jgi:PAS domain S-box-containing protein
MHPLLARQLKRLGLDEQHVPPSLESWGALLERINRSYVEADQGHELLERSLAISSKEMQELYAQHKHTSETQLARERNKLEAVLQSMADGLCVVDSEWKILLVNHQAERLFGKSVDDLKGRLVYQMISPGPLKYKEECLITDDTFPPLDSGEPYRTDEGLLVTADDQLLPIGLAVTPMLMDDEIIGAVLVFNDISMHKQAERGRQQTEALLRRIQGGLSELAKSPQIYSGNLTESFRTITRVAAECLHVERVGIWFLTEDCSALRCVDLYQRATQHHSHGLVLSAAEYPRYFEELAADRVLAAEDAQRDSRTSEFTEGYLVPLGITSLLDVPIRSEGRIVGVICHEHLGPIRAWTLEEQHFAVALANTVALAIEAADRRKMEHALRTSEGRLTTTVQSTNIGIWDWDLNSNQMYLSPEWKRQLGYEDLEIENTFQEWESRMHPEDRGRVLTALQTYLGGRQSQFELEHRLCHRDGSYRWILARGTFIKNEADLSTRMVGINIDVTDRRVAEEALRQAKEAAEAASLAKSQFLANMSHEIRTPMNGVLGMAELLLRCPLNDKERYLAGSIHRSGMALLGIINDILDFSKIEAGKLQLETIPFDVRRTIQEAVELSGPSAQRKQVALSCRIGSLVPSYLLGDPTRIRQILVNLVGNAVKFTERGSVDVSVDCRHERGELYELLVAVQDTGIGIAAEAQSHIFDAFSQADGSMTRKYGGTGLGLAIVRQLVVLMGGTIELQSRLGEGSRFSFTLQCAGYAHAGTSLLPSAPTSESRGRGWASARPQEAGSAESWILLVEDNAVNREVACGMLEALNCRIDTVGNGREAVAAVADREYALVFMDCQMPEMDGLMATKLIREHEALEAGKRTDGKQGVVRHVPIVGLTAHAMQGDRELCLAAGMDDYLTKPCTISQLEQMLARWMPKTAVLRTGHPEGAQAVEPSSGSGDGRMPSPRMETLGGAIKPAIIDPAALAGIRALQRPGRPDILTHICSQYLESSQKSVERIRRAVFSNNAVELRAAAHSLKSSSAQLGASALAADCGALEVMGAKDDMSRAEETLNRLEQDYAAACAALHAEVLKGAGRRDEESCPEG